jgi:hypothetical protein
LLRRFPAFVDRQGFNDRSKISHLLFVR